jgi:hypothetical protein
MIRHFKDERVWAELQVVSSLEKSTDYAAGLNI